MNKKLNIIFMGTPDFSVPVLNALHSSEHNVLLVITQPDKPKGRGRNVIFPPVKEAAIKMGYNVIQPASIKTDDVAAHIERLQPDIFVVAAFGHILPKDILSLAKQGAINIHASLLPKYRGSAPIQWAIINGEKETGVTTMLMNEGLDTGDILLAEKIKITPDDTAATLHDRMAVIGAELLIRTLETFDDIQPIPQVHEQATYTHLLKKEDGHINWNKPADFLETFIRGVTPWPGAFTFHGNNRLKIFKTKPLRIDTAELPGSVIKRFENELVIATGKDALSILEIQSASGKRLLIGDFIRGYPLPVGTILR